jgi:uncharacterized protein with NRDE domain
MPMCLLAIFFRVVSDAPLVIGANREEAYDRGGEPPQLLSEPALAVAGLDPKAGGTWLGLNQHGVVVAVTNRLKTQLPANPRSRGLLARDLLSCSTASEAVEKATHELNSNRYAGCNLFCADRERATVLHAGDWLRVRMLPPGIHVVTNHDVNDASDPRVDHALGWLGQCPYADGRECIRALQMLCSRAAPPAICLHGEKGGTVSSSVLLIRQPLCEGSYLHAQGPPDTTPYADYSYLLKQLVPES